MQQEKQIYETLINHIKERKTVNRLYSNRFQSWLSRAQILSFMVMGVAIIFHRFNPNEISKYAGLLSLAIFCVSYAVYILSLAFEMLREFASPTSAMYPLVTRMERDELLYLKLNKFSREVLDRVNRRLIFMRENQNTQISFILGATSKLGIVPAVLALYAIYTSAFVEKLPDNIDVVVLTAVVFLYLIATAQKLGISRIDSMIFFVGESLALNTEEAFKSE